MFLCLVSVEMKWLLPPPAVVVVAVAVAVAVAEVEVVLMVATLAEVAVLAGPGLGGGRQAREERGSLLAVETVSGRHGEG